MKTFLTLLLIVLAFAGGFALAVFLKSDDFVITKRQVVNAPPEKVFEYVSAFKKGEAWSPWFEKDPNAKKEYSEPDSGVGAKFKWSSDVKDVGEGTQEITAVTPNQLVRTKLEFTKPFQGSANAEIVLRPIDNDKTEVTWTMWSKQGFMEKGMCLIMQMPKELEKTFGEGLDNLNRVVSEKKDAK